MKNKILFFTMLAILTACNSEPGPRSTFVSVETPIPTNNRPAKNISISNKAVTSVYTYPNAEASFHLRYDQCAVIEMDSTVTMRDADVYQTSPGTWIADFGGGEYIRINTKTGRTEIYYTSENGVGIYRRVYQKADTP